MTTPTVRVGVSRPSTCSTGILIPQSPDHDLAVAGPAAVRKLLGPV